MQNPAAVWAEANFDAALNRHGLGPLQREAVTIMQVNVGRLCNQACHHCHVDAGPARREVMPRRVAERVVELLERSPAVGLLDLTGGAPELNPEFRWMVQRARALGRRVMVRCNLTVLFAAGLEWLPEFYRDHAVELVCSLPCYTAENVDRQRGQGVFARSIDALQVLNRLGYGAAGSRLSLDLVYNPGGASLPPAQAELEVAYRDALHRSFGVQFRRLLTLANMPINRFAEQLDRGGQYAEYMGLLVNHFNPRTVDNLMCRHLVSIGWDGGLYDCDFNQMLALPIGAAGPGGERLTVWDVEHFDGFAGAAIATAPHCFGCTAGAGSSCGGTLVA